MEGIPEDTGMQVDTDDHGMPVAELIGWEPIWTTSLIASFYVCQLVNKYLLNL